MTPSAFGLVAAIGLFAVACGDEQPVVATDDVGDSYIALQQDFLAFQDWQRYELPDGAHAGNGLVGPKRVYVNRLPDTAKDAFPVGTIVVKTIEVTTAPEGWTVHAMAKRGRGFNADGALDWEWFELRMADVQTPVIVWRGLAPPDGEGYGGGDGIADQDCNSCHAGTSDRAILQFDELLQPR